MTVSFTLDGEPFVALNGQRSMPGPGPVSFVINCETQAEVDHFWSTLSEGGTPNQCGWLADRYGIAWQVVPTALPRLLQHKDPATSARVMQAMLKMTKIEIAALEAAAAGE